MRCLVDHPRDPRFAYIAVAPWPLTVKDEYCIDWTETVDTIEQWLNQYVGSHWDQWIYSTAEYQTPWECCVAFRVEKYRSLFLLQWR